MLLLTDWVEKFTWSFFVEKKGKIWMKATRHNGRSGKHWKNVPKPLFLKTNFVGADPEKLKWLPACLGIQSPETGWRDRKSRMGVSLRWQLKQHGVYMCIYTYTDGTKLCTNENTL